MNKRNDTILVVDFGGGDAQNIAKELRVGGVYSEILAYTSHQSISTISPKGVVLSGEYDKYPEVVTAIDKLSLPTLRADNHIVATELKEFALKRCKAKATWSVANFITLEVERIKEIVGDKKVLCALSGGVDSAVTAALIHRAIGSNLTCMFVDTGLMRLGEKDIVVKTFQDEFKIKLIDVNAEERFLTALKGVFDPEKKRKIIGELFIRIFEEESNKLDKHHYLAQGTLYADIIESITVDGTVAVKSHHNVGGLPDDIQFELLEPLKMLFKDEVRAVGVELGLSPALVYRHPFPGPGIGVRILGEVTKEYCDTLRQADFIAIDELKKAGLYNDVWQAFCVLLPVKSVGVVDGKREYSNVIAFRSVNGVDGLTAVWSQLPYDLLGRISNRIIKEVVGVSRVVYDISSKPPATIEWE